MTHFASPLSDDFLVALGRVTANFALLELQLAGFAGTLVNKDDSGAGQIVTAELPFRKLRALVSSLFLLRIEDPALRVELNALLARAAQVEVQRNTVIHSFWGAGDTEATRVRIKRTAKEGKGIRQQFEHMTAQQIEEIAREAGTVAYDIQMFEIKLPRNIVNVVEISVP